MSTKYDRLAGFTNAIPEQKLGAAMGVVDLAGLGSHIWWELCLLGATLLNVIEGGKPKRSVRPQRRVDIGSVLEALPEPVVLLDPQGHIANLNRHAEKLTGQPRAALMHCDAAGILQPRLDGATDLHSLLSRASRGEVIRGGQATFHCPSGDALRLNLSISPVFDIAGQVTGILLTLQDVTELTALQRHSETNERHVAVGQMTAGLVHDFNNVLTAINEAVTVLEEDDRSDRDRTVLGIIENAVHSGSETVRNTRDYLVGSREKPSEFRILHLLEEVLELTHPILKGRTGIKVIRELQDCGEVRASADELRRAFTNLVLNALDAMPKGGTLTVRCAPVEQRVMVTVQDTGMGIPQEYQRKIFSPYFTTKPHGTGLGLAGARRAVLSQGGDIRFESKAAVGTSFYVTLPIVAGSVHPKPGAAYREVS